MVRILQGALGSYDSGYWNSGLSEDEILTNFIKFFVMFIFIVAYTTKTGFNRLKPIIIVFSIPSLIIGFIVASDIGRHPYDNPFFLVLGYMIVTWLPSMIFGYILHLLYSVVTKVLWKD